MSKLEGGGLFVGVFVDVYKYDFAFCFGVGGDLLQNELAFLPLGHSLP